MAKTDYGIDAETFVTEWEKAESMDDIYEALKAIGEKLGRPPMPKAIILSRASEYRSAKVPLKMMPRVSSRSIDVKGLTDLVMKVRADKPATPPATPTPEAVPPGLTREDIVAVVVEALERLQRPPKSS